MSSISVSSLVLGSLTVEVDGADASLALSVLGTAPASLTIELGTPGAQGNAATIAVGTTTTLNPGESATVVNVGTSSAATFNFGIPKGEQGVQGIQGSPGTAATATAGTTTTGAPGSSASVVNAGTTSAAVFNFTIPRGDVGATGATGATGPAGPGVPVGGTANQSLLKVDGTDYNTTWGTPPLATLATSSETVIATVRNATGSTLTAGQVVYINGAIGNRPSVALARADLEATSSGTYGMVSAPIANNSDGTIVIAGFVANLNTSAYTDGDLLYLSPTVAGGFTSTKPTAPDNLVYVGVVTRSHPTLGVVQLRISNGFELDELHDVSATTPSNSDLLAFETSTNLWKNKSAATLGLATTSASDAAYLAKASNLSDLAGPLSTARTNLGLGTAAVEPATKLVPTGGTTGQVLAKASNTNWDLTWTTAGGGGGASSVTSYWTPGTYSYTIPSGATNILVYLWGAGGGGGSGARNVTTGLRTGGSGGGNGAFAAFHFKAADISSPATVVVAAGGAGGAAVTTNATVGVNGTMQATLTSFAGYVTANGGGGPGGSITAAAVTGGSQRNNTYTIVAAVGQSGGQGIAGTGGSSGTIGSNVIPGPAGGGGGGGQQANITNPTNGGTGGSRASASANLANGNNVLIIGGAGGIPGTSLPVAGQSYTNNFGGMGGGGGGYRVGNAGQDGAAGGSPGGGGGGGGGSDNGFNSGAGGTGGNGAVVIFAY